jgi:NADPH2:quinone reductase
MQSAIVRHAGGPESISIEDLPVPEPGKGQVRIKVAYSALNPLDTHARADRIKWQHPGFPFTPGFEYAGLVNAIGEDIDHDLIGKRVAVNTGWGGNAEFAIAPAALLNLVPDGLDWRTAATYSTCAYTAWLLIHSAGKVQEGQIVAIHSAAGAVGALTSQVAKSAGAVVIALAGGPAKLTYAEQFGADYLIDYNDDTWPEQVMAATNGQGADLIIDGNAGPNASRNLMAIAPLGNIIITGATAGQAPDLDIAMIIGKSCSVSGFIQYFHQVNSAGAEKIAVHEKLISGEWRIPIEKIYPLAEVSEAHRAWEARELVGRTLIKSAGEL